MLGLCPKTVNSLAILAALHFAIHSCHSIKSTQVWMNTMGITGFVYTPPKQNKRSSLTNSDSKKARTIYRERIKAWIYILKHTCWKRVLPLFSFLWDDFNSYGDVQDTKIQHSNNERNTYCTFTSANHVPSDNSRIILSFLNTKSWFCMWLCSRFNF